MKNVIIIGVGSIVSMLIIFQVFLLMYAEKPELFVADVKKTPDAVAAQVDSVKVPAPVKSDSVITKKLAVPVMQTVKEEPVPPKKIPEAAVQKSSAQVDSVDWKSKAKILEAMNADDAAKIITTMKDHEIKAILGKLKKKTAAKILASLEPNRAAKLLR